MIEAKGKNGYFKVATIEVWKVNNSVVNLSSEIHIDIYPKKRGDAPPARLEGTEEEMRNLISTLYDAVIKNGTEFCRPVIIKL